MNDASPTRTSGRERSASAPRSASILRNFLKRQHDDGIKLAAESDLLALTPLPSGDEPPSHYVVELRVRGLALEQGGAVVEHDRWVFGVAFHEDHLRFVDPSFVMLFEPATAFHPNLRAPLVCLGRISPGIGLVDVIFQLADIITYRNWAAHDGLNPAACQWSRNNADRFPIDNRPLKRRHISMTVAAASSEHASSTPQPTPHSTATHSTAHDSTASDSNRNETQASTDRAISEKQA